MAFIHRFSYLQSPLSLGTNLHDVDSNTLAESLQSEDTVYSADSIEFSPVQQEIFVCGTYQIQKLEDALNPNEEHKATADDSDGEEEIASAPKTRRLGRALVYQVAEDGQSLYVTSSSTVTTQRFPLLRLTCVPTVKRFRDSMAQLC